MKISLSEANELCDWEEFCDMFGFDYYCMTWGNTSLEVDMTIEQAKQLGIITDRDRY